MTACKTTAFTSRHSLNKDEIVIMRQMHRLFGMPSMDAHTLLATAVREGFNTSLKTFQGIGEGWCFGRPVSYFQRIPQKYKRLFWNFVSGSVPRNGGGLFISINENEPNFETNLKELSSFPNHVVWETQRSQNLEKYSHKVFFFIIPYKDLPTKESRDIILQQYREATQKEKACV